MLTNKSLSKATLVVALTTLVSTASIGAAADTAWQKQHPRRHEVNARLANQNRRIHHEVKEGDLTQAQGHQLHQEDRTIRQEERDMAKLDHGHLTKADQRALNQQENAVSHQIGK